MADFEVKIATDPREIVEAQRLRFQVFNLELNKGLQRSYQTGLDVDEFDAFCGHLIVRENKSDEMVGTYRMMRGAQARQHFGFYSEKEFDLSQIKKLDGELLEFGRSCARKDFRDRALLPLMWEAIAEQVRAHKVRYLFGCGSLYTTEIAKSALCLLSSKINITRLNIAVSSPWMAADLPVCRMRQSAVADDAALFHKLPSLIKGYLRIGALVCGPPALDAEFGTADFFLLLDFDNLKDEYLKRLGLTDVKSDDAPA